jgi:uncharacterized repeat protein (TIGR03803 family)
MPPSNASPLKVKATVTESLLYSFGAFSIDGKDSTADMIEAGGQLYGTTLGGGSNCIPSSGCGTVFTIRADGTGYEVLHNFAGAPYDGRNPDAGLINFNGTLYGTTSSGGHGDWGTVFSITTAGTEKVIYSFAGRLDGAYPGSNLTQVNGTFYGTTGEGGTHNFGTVFSITPSGDEKILYRFAGGTDGENPGAGLTNVNGTLYGTTQFGGGSRRCGTQGCGTVFSITTDGVEKVVHRFTGGGTGRQPNGLTNVNGTLYGTTSRSQSTVFRIKITCATSCVTKYKLLYSFAKNSYANGRLKEINGTLYGTTYAGGVAGPGCLPYGCGTVFSITTAGMETTVYEFAGKPDGDAPEAGLTAVRGTLYGTTAGGGQYNEGTIFSLSGF